MVRPPLHLRGEDEPQVIRTSGAGRRFAHLLHCGEKQADEDRDDRDNNEELDQSETAPGGTRSVFCGNE